MNSPKAQPLEAAQTAHAACEKKTNQHLAQLDALVQEVADPALKRRFASEQLMIYQALMEERAASATLSLERGNLTAMNGAMAVEQLQRHIRELTERTAES